MALGMSIAISFQSPGKWPTKTKIEMPSGKKEFQCFSSLVTKTIFDLNSQQSHSFCKLPYSDLFLKFINIMVMFWTQKHFKTKIT